MTAIQNGFPVYYLDLDAAFWDQFALIMVSFKRVWNNAHHLGWQLSFFYFELENSLNSTN